MEYQPLSTAEQSEICRSFLIGKDVLRPKAKPRCEGDYSFQSLANGKKMINHDRGKNPATGDNPFESLQNFVA
jgi:hypothetical protein